MIGVNLANDKNSRYGPSRVDVAIKNKFLQLVGSLRSWPVRAEVTRGATKPERWLI